MNYQLRRLTDKQIREKMTDCQVDIYNAECEKCALQAELNFRAAQRALKGKKGGGRSKATKLASSRGTDRPNPLGIWAPRRF